MSFRPLYDRHAIHEVVFVVTLKRELEPQEVKVIIDAHERWREQLPKFSPTTAHRVVFGDAPLPADVKPYEELGIAGALFDALKRDGSLDWRLRIERNFIAVNCLSYTRWRDIWSTAKNLLDQVCAIVVNPKLPVVGAALQYIDEFVWEGDIKDYRFADLFREDDEFLPANVRTKGPLWHLYQGWFQYDGLSVPGRRLQKIHIDGVERDGKWVTRIDTTLRHDFDDEWPSNTAVFGSKGESAPIDSVFGDMHDESKRLLAKFITQEVAERISLNV